MPSLTDSRISRPRSSSSARCSVVAWSDACWASSSQGLLRQGGGLALGLFQQSLGANIALQDLEAHRQNGHQLVQQRLLPGPEAREGRQLQHRQQAVIAQHRQQQDDARRGLAQAGANRQVVRRGLGELDGRALQGALADQTLAKFDTTAFRSERSGRA
jgi:hypothetical protein